MPRKVAKTQKAAYRNLVEKSIANNESLIGKCDFPKSICVHQVFDKLVSQSLNVTEKG